MKNLILLTFFTYSSIVSATELVANVRNSKQKLVTQTVSIPELQNVLAETEDFKILLGTSGDSIDLSNTRTIEDKIKVATVLYHLSIAHDYFMNQLHSDHVANLPQISVRIEMSKPFNENLHFIAESKDEEFNNALTIPSSSSKALAKIPAWGMEIWFRPMKEFNIDNLVYQAASQIDQVDVSQVIGSLVERSVSDAVLQATLSESLSGIDYMGYLSQLLYTVGALEVFPKVIKFATKSIKSKAYLDTALIPEVIYHEFSHVALSDFISVRKSTPLNEGLANYFAAVINNSAKIAAKNGDASKNIGAYNGNSKEMYHSLLETKKSGQTNFVFSFLWRLRDRLSKEYNSGDLLADKLIFNARKYVRYADKPIKDDLLPSLRDAITETVNAHEARKLRMILNEVALKAGI